MRLMHIISSLKHGGAEMLLIELVREFADRDHRQIVLFFHDGPCRKEIEKLGVETIKIGGWWCLYDPFFWWRLWQAIRRWRPSVIHSSLWAANWCSSLLGYLFKVPVVCAVHAMPMVNGRFKTLLDRVPYALAPYIIAVSPAVATQVKKRSWWPAQVGVICNGIDVKRFNEHCRVHAKTRTELALHQDHWVIGSVGRLDPIKNYPLLLRCIAALVTQYPQVRLVLVGSGFQEAYLKRYADNLGITSHVQIITGEYAWGYYQLFDCFVQPSSSEGLSLALLEAMASGLSCVVTQSVDDEHPVIIDSYNGFISSADYEDMCTILKKIITNEHMRSQIGIRALDTVFSKFSLQSMSRKYENVFEKYKIKKYLKHH